MIRARFLQRAHKLIIGLGFVLGFILCAGAAPAQVQTESYATLARQLDGRVSFEILPTRPEPGINLDAPLRFTGLWLGERLVGQRVAGMPHDRISGTPKTPLAIAPGAHGQNLSVARHRGFGSNALFPLGARGFPALKARGEGAVTVLFDRDQASFGLRIHADYADPLGQQDSLGEVQLVLFSRAGKQIGVVDVPLRRGITEIALRRDGNIPDIAAITVTNTDPGGIAIDDILYQIAALIG